MKPVGIFVPYFVSVTAYAEGAAILRCRHSILTWAQKTLQLPALTPDEPQRRGDAAALWHGAQDREALRRAHRCA